MSRWCLSASAARDFSRALRDPSRPFDRPVLVRVPNVRSILTSLLDVVRRGMEVKRLKGLGEMDREQLWETTMDVSKRTMLRVTMEDAQASDSLFSILMGENVEQRRNYIEEHALEVKSLDA